MNFFFKRNRTDSEAIELIFEAGGKNVVLAVVDEGILPDEIYDELEKNNVVEIALEVVK